MPFGVSGSKIQASPTLLSIDFVRTPLLTHIHITRILRSERLKSGPLVLVQVQDFKDEVVTPMSDAFEDAVDVVTSSLDPEAIESFITSSLDPEAIGEFFEVMPVPPIRSHARRVRDCM